MISRAKRSPLAVEVLEDRAMPSVAALGDTYWVLPDVGSNASSVLANDTGSGLYVSEVNSSSGNVGGQITLSGGHLLTMNANGTFSITPGQYATFISFNYTTTDDTDSDTATASIYVNNPTPALLYATYEAAVATADADYVDAVNDAADARDAAVAAASAAAQDDAADLYDDYLAAYAQAETAYLAASANADGDYQDAIDAADTAWDTAEAAAMADYVAAMEDPQDDLDAAIAALDDDYVDAIADADSDYTSGVAPYLTEYSETLADLATAQGAVASAQSSLSTAIASAAATKSTAYYSALTDFETALNSALDDYDAALQVASETYDSAMAAAASAYASAIAATASLESARDAAYTAWQNDIENYQLEEAYYQAEDALNDAIDTAQSDRDTAEDNALNAHDTAVSDAETALVSAQTDAQFAYDEALSDADDAYDSTLESYQTDVSSAESDVSDLMTSIASAEPGLAAVIEARNAAYAGALAAYNSGVEAAQAVFDEADADALSLYHSALAEADDDWSQAEESARGDFEVAMTAADDEFVDAEEDAWNDYLTYLATLNAALDTTVAGIEDDFDAASASALAAWEADVDDAWDTYLAAMSTIPGTPGSGHEVTAPQPVQVAELGDVGVQQFLRENPDFFCGVSDIDRDSLTVTYVNPPPNTIITLAGGVVARVFTFRVTATGTMNQTADLYWGVREIDPGRDDHLWEDRPFTLTFDGNGNYSQMFSFYLFCDRNGDVRGPDESSWERNTDGIYVTVGTRWREMARTPTGQQIFAVGRPSVPTGATATTTGWNAETCAITVTLAPPPGFNGDLDRTASALVAFTFTVTITGAEASTTVANLRWSVIEPDYFPPYDDELYKERAFSVPIGATGVGTFTGTFRLFANKAGEVGGFDENSDEARPHPIYVLIETSGGSNLFVSNRITVSGR